MSHAVTSSSGLQSKVVTTAATTIMDISTLNGLGFESFTGIFGNVVENCTIVTGAVWTQRPFTSYEHLCQAYSNVIDNLPFHLKEGLLRCQADLAGKHAKQGSLSTESTQEHHSAGLSDLSSNEQERMNLSNQLYKRKFNVPFVVCVGNHSKSEILDIIVKRLDNNHEEEILIGVGEVKKIALRRMANILETKSNL